VGGVAVPGTVASRVTSVAWWLVTVSGVVAVLLPAVAAVASGVAVVASCVEWFTATGSSETA
jgi:hypothetical protein